MARIHPGRLVRTVLESPRYDSEYEPQPFYLVLGISPPRVWLRSQFSGQITTAYRISELEPVDN